VHTVYGGAQLFKADTARRLGVLALSALDDYGPDATTFGSALGLPGRLVEPVYARVREKLGREPVEDFRIDYEDGYGNRPDAEEDGHAVQGAEELARGLKAGTAATFGGIRIKPLSPELAARSLRTLDLWVSTFVRANGGRWDDGPRDHAAQDHAPRAGHGRRGARRTGKETRASRRDHPDRAHDRDAAEHLLF
jgi:hypothetical protein